MEGVLVVDQADIGLVKRGQPVRLLLPQLSPSLATGRVTEIARVDVTALPRELALEHKLPTRITDHGTVRPASATYEVRVALDETPCPLTPGTTGDARIRAGTMSLAERGMRWARRTFAAEL
jgi:hypothetical protein